MALGHIRARCLSFHDEFGSPCGVVVRVHIHVFERVVMFKLVLFTRTVVSDHVCHGTDCISILRDHGM